MRRAFCALPLWRGLLVRCGLAFFIVSVSPLAAFANEEVSFSGYLTRVTIALVLFALGGWLVVRFYAPGSGAPTSVGVEVRAVVPLGRDLLRVVRCGPDVLALLSTKGETVVIGRWSKEEWEKGCGASQPH